MLLRLERPRSSLSRRSEEPPWVRKNCPLHIYISYDQDTLYFTRWNDLFTRIYFIRLLESSKKITIKTVAFDLDYPRSTPLHWRYVITPQTILMVLPTDSRISGSKDKKLVPSQRTTPTRNMNQVELDILQNWNQLIYDSPGHLKSFKALETDLGRFFERMKETFTNKWIENGSDASSSMIEWVNWKTPKVEVMELVD
jgi:hypothetical protein